VIEEAAGKRPINRREMFGRLGRWLGLVALGAVAARLTVGRQVGKSGGPVRPFSSRCAACPAINVCLLPEAETARTQGVGLVGAVRGAPGAGPVLPFCRAGKDAAGGRVE
jgi:hypothetical protein